MAQKEIEVMNFMKEKCYVDIEEMQQKLEDPNLPAIERRRLEAYLKNFQIRVMPSIEKKQSIIAPVSYVRDKKNTESRKKHATNIKIKAGIVLLLAATAVGGIKLQHDAKEKRIETLRSYDKTFSMVDINYGDTLTSIAEAVYQTYPQDVKNYITLQNLIDEIMYSNHLMDEDKIIAGHNIVVPYYSEPKEKQENFVK